MRLGYSYRLSQYALGLGILGLFLAGGLVFFLNLMSLRTEQYQVGLSTKLARAEHTEDSASGGQAPEYTPPPPTGNLPRRAALQTIRMLRPMGYYLACSGAFWLTMHLVSRKATG